MMAVLGVQSVSGKSTENVSMRHNTLSEDTCRRRGLQSLFAKEFPIESDVSLVL